MLIASLIARLLEPAEPGSRAQEEALIAVQRTCPSRARPPRTWYSSTAGTIRWAWPWSSPSAIAAPNGSGLCHRAQPAASCRRFDLQKSVGTGSAGTLRTLAPTSPRSTIDCLLPRACAEGLHGYRRHCRRRSQPPTVHSRPPFAATCRMRPPAARGCQPSPLPVVCSRQLSAAAAVRSLLRSRPPSPPPPSPPPSPLPPSPPPPPSPLSLPSPTPPLPSPTPPLPSPTLQSPSPLHSPPPPTPSPPSPCHRRHCCRCPRPCHLRTRPRHRRTCSPRPSAHDGRMRDTRTRSRTRARTCTPPAFSACASDAPRLACVLHRVAFKRPLAGHLP